jgi:hypothetical protein
LKKWNSDKKEPAKAGFVNVEAASAAQVNIDQVTVFTRGRAGFLTPSERSRSIPD